MHVDSLPSEPPAKPLRGQVLHFSPGSRLPRADGASVSTRTRDPSLFTDEETEGQRGLVTCPGSHSGRQQLQFQAHLPPSTPTPVPGPEELPTRAGKAPSLFQLQPACFISSTQCVTPVPPWLPGAPKIWSTVLSKMVGDSHH